MLCSGSREKWMLLLYRLSLFCSAKDPSAWCCLLPGVFSFNIPFWDHPHRHTQRCASSVPRVWFILRGQQLKLATTLKHDLICSLALDFDSGAMVEWAENPEFTACSSLGSPPGSPRRWAGPIVLVRVTFLSSGFLIYREEHPLPVQLLSVAL